MRNRSNTARAEKAIARASQAIDRAGWRMHVVLGPPQRFVAVKRVFERDDESETKLFESDFTVEGLASLVERRERERS